MKRKTFMIIGVLGMALVSACTHNNSGIDIDKEVPISEQDKKENINSEDIYVEENNVRGEKENNKFADVDQTSNNEDTILRGETSGVCGETEYTDSKNTNLKDNELMEKINRTKIDDQSFDIELNDWGNVTFVICMPDIDENPLTDISVYLIKDEKILYHFPDIQDDNISMAGICDGVSFVYFEDINNDGKDDIVIGAVYETGAGAQGMIPYTQVRIYEDTGCGFVYNQELCDTINAELPQDVTAEQVKEMILK